MRNAAIALGFLLASCVSGPQGLGEGPPAAAIYGAWKLNAIAGAPVLAGTSPTLRLAADGHVSGNGGCNGFGASFTRRGDALTFSQLVHTMMACTRPGLTSEQVMDQEHHFLSALDGEVRASTPQANILVITAASGEALRFERAP